MTSLGRIGTTLATTMVLMAALAAPATAQYSAPKLTSEAVGEKYHIEASAGLWNPSVFGVIASEQFGQLGTKVDFTTDLKFAQKRFPDFRFVLRPSKRNKLYAQYTPISFASDTTLPRPITFNGQTFSANLPIQASFDWKVWRIGYELDIISTARGYLGLTVEGRLTNFGASIRAPSYPPEFTRAKGPLPAAGAIARVYPIRNFSVTGSVSGFKVPDALKDYGTGNYIDWDVYGTFNVNNYIGVQGGWRKLSTTVTIKKDFGDMKYQGVWLGAVVRY